MIVAVSIKTILIMIGIVVGIAAISTLVKRNTTPVFSVIWVCFGVVLVLTGIFIEPYNWTQMIGIPTLFFIGILTMALIVFLWFITKKIDEIQHKFLEMVIQLTLIRDENAKLKKQIEQAEKKLVLANEQLQADTNLSERKIAKQNFNKYLNIKNKNVLFVNNTLSTGGAEKVLLPLMKKFISNNNDVHLYVITGMGELVSQLPEGVKLLNENFDKESVLTAEGKRLLTNKVIAAETKSLTGLRLFGYQARAIANMIRNGKFQAEKLAWRALAETSPKISNEYDLAVAFTEGASTYYVADRVAAKHKIAFVHTPYEHAGYTKQLDKHSYDAFNEILAVSENVRKSFLNVHPECLNKVFVKENDIDVNGIEKLSEADITNEMPWEIGNSKDKSAKILTVSRLVGLKAYDRIIETAKILKKQGLKFKWVALGEGEDHAKIQNLIDKEGLSQNIILMGNVLNPYPYMKYCDLYVHVSNFEGKSVAVQEARALGCAIILSDVDGNKDQIRDGYSGLFCSLEPNDIAQKITYLLNNPLLANNMGENARKSFEQ